MLWTTSLETGIRKIDEQHKELFRQADVLLDKTKADRLPDTIKFLGDYVVKHFTDEQMIHNNSHYPKAAPHKTMHVNFVAKFKELKKQFDESGDKVKFDVVLSIHHLVVHWLTDHIMVHDKEFAKYYKEHGGTA